MKTLKLLVSPAALCIWAIFVCVGFSVAPPTPAARSHSSQETKYGYAKAAFPIHMQRWDEALYNLLAARAKTEMAEFLKGAGSRMRRQGPGRGSARLDAIHAVCRIYRAIPDASRWKLS